jgi:hypothetical protein
MCILLLPQLSPEFFSIIFLATKTTNMDLFPGEEYLVRSNSERLVLTTHRIELTNKDWGSSYRSILFLEDISSIEIRYTSLLIALLAGIVLIVGGIMWFNQSSVSPLNPATIAGGLAILFYFLSRRHVVSISPNGGRPLNFEIGSMSQQEVNEFIDKVQLAKLARRNQLYHN